jgi:ferredoxin
MEWTKTQEYKDELDICIRCGYCYEKCPLFKAQRWEADTPRAKLVMLFRMLTGEIQCTDDIADKIAECFNCKACERSCSAKVQVTSIIKAAVADMLAAGYEFYGTTARVDQDLCSRCGTCVSVCKDEAISPNEDGKMVVDVAKCTSCGVCVATCPSGAISQKRGFNVTPDELSEKVECYLAGGVR